MEKEFKYKSQYGVVVVCDSEEHQKEIYEKLVVTGLKLKVVCV